MDWRSGLSESGLRHFRTNTHFTLLSPNVFGLIHDGAGIGLLCGCALADARYYLAGWLADFTAIDRFLQVASKFTLGNIQGLLQAYTLISDFAYFFGLANNRNGIARIGLTVKAERR